MPLNTGTDRKQESFLSTVPGTDGPTSPEERIGCVILAAGAGTRFQGVKQLADLGGRPLLSYALATAATARAERRVLVLGANAETVLGRIPLNGVEPVLCNRWQEGMSASLRTGIGALSDLDAVVILLGDQPFVTAGAVDRLLQSRTGRDQATRSSYEGRPGHPVVLERALYEQIRNLNGDEGARRILARARTLEIPCDDIADPFDIDRPVDLIEAHVRLATRSGGRG